MSRVQPPPTDLQLEQIALGELDGDVFRAAEEHELAVVKAHDLVAQFHAGGLELDDLGVEIIDRETDVVEAEPVELVDVRVR